MDDCWTIFGRFLEDFEIFLEDFGLADFHIFLDDVLRFLNDFCSLPQAQKKKLSPHTGGTHKGGTAGADTPPESAPLGSGQVSGSETSFWHTENDGLESGHFQTSLRLGACLDFLIDLFAFWPRSRPI